MSFRSSFTPAPMDETGDRLDRLIRSSSALRAEAERLRLSVQDTVGKDAFGVAPLNRRTAARLTPEADACPDPVQAGATSIPSACVMLRPLRGMRILQLPRSGAVSAAN